MKKLLLLLLCLLLCCSCSLFPLPPEQSSSLPLSAGKEFSLPAYEGEPYVILGDNRPAFSLLSTEAYEHYAPLDALGRCGPAETCLGKELMPTEPREEIYMIRPTGWHSVQYDFIDEGSLYNRCHLIGFQLAGENANEKNLITGTRSMNVLGMLPFENRLADYIRETGNHVMYRVTPVFEGNELLARGVRMEALSVEDGGAGICFDIFAFNAEPGVELDYRDGSHRLISSQIFRLFVLNTSSLRIHRPSCQSVASISEKNKKRYEGDPQALLQQGYRYCGSCFPDS